MTESVKIEAWIETISQEIVSTKSIRKMYRKKVITRFDKFNERLCALKSDAQKQACHARLAELAVMERKTE